jgi:hypothetical protein
MPVKKSIRGRKSTRTSRLAFVERSVKFAKSVNLASVMHVKKLTKQTTGMDTAIGLPLIGTVVVVMLIGAGTLSRQNADEFTEAATAHADSSIVDGLGVPSVEVAHDVELAALNQVAQPAPVTITGCLERDGDTFRQKDTSRADAPRSRSWKSAFLKKGSAPLEVVDASKRLKLTNHVGQRVSVTGPLSDGDMQIRSLRRVAATCKNTSSRATV